MVASGVGYHLDNFGRWLIGQFATDGGAYAALLAPGEPQPRAAAAAGTSPQEYYEQRRWLACRRGALWEAARGQASQVPLTVRWYRGTTVDVTLGNDNSLCLYVCGSFEPNEFAFLDKVLRPGMVFVDVGANDGYYTLFARPAGRHARARAGGRAQFAASAPTSSAISPATASATSRWFRRRWAPPAAPPSCGWPRARIPATTRWAASPTTACRPRASSGCRCGPSTTWWPSRSSTGSTSSRSTSRAPRRA